MSATSITQDAQPSVHGVGSQPRHDSQLGQGSELSESAQDNHWLARKVGELVAEDFRRAHVFSKFGIDFCCGGGKPLAVACERADIDPAKVVAALNAVTLTGSKEDELNQLPLDQLVDYIESTHHQYVREKAPLLVEYSEKMVRAHGEHYAEIIPFAGWVRALVEDLMSHLMKEEKILFPAIRGLSQAEQVETCFGHMGNPINAMQNEHEEVGLILQKLRELTNDFTPPEHACTTWRVCYATLAEFEADLHQHIHLENNILFPKALDLAQ
ncbi:iron-sulfur cluster repair di-iron protein [Shewanella baltica OS183]|uniref:iron-sulfur cluster repair di-iron protein n=1 Tax=Shewanella baltica TaxID=62322 RepID=UPI0001E10A23|nr:iron-sulfur cluster repair di-iron protein [Shewanella baltica]AEG09716.1 iron-sulfur cluster repair di-iron protein [Shewanella baltica BA175]EHQ16768.1 iron-sulfur cluster repair di-iron protein [Shewanella baltica OS183]